MMEQVSSCNGRKLIVVNTFFFKRVVIILKEIVLGDCYIYVIKTVKLMPNQLVRAVGCNRSFSFPLLFFVLDLTCSTTTSSQYKQLVFDRQVAFGKILFGCLHCVLSNHFHVLKNKFHVSSWKKFTFLVVNIHQAIKITP